MTHVRRREPQSTIDIVEVDGTWMVRQTMTAEDAESMAFMVDPKDGVHDDLFQASQDAARRNDPEAGDPT
jgi:hypothetical protein